MSTASGTVNNPAIDNLVQSCYVNESEWIPWSEITDIESSQIDNIYYAIRKQTRNDGEVEKTMIMLLCLGTSEECTPTFVSEFARIYSLPTHKYIDDVSQFRRYAKWLSQRNKQIYGFTEYKDNYYMVVDELFHHCYSRYGFCTACGIPRCSPVWCICGHKQLSDGWTSNNKQLDEFIKKSQLQTNSANDVYLEWIPFDSVGDGDLGVYLWGLPTHEEVELIPLKITDETHDLYYAEVNHLLMRHVY